MGARKIGRESITRFYSTSTPAPFSALCKMIEEFGNPSSVDDDASHARPEHLLLASCGFSFCGSLARLWHRKK